MSVSEKKIYLGKHGKVHGPFSQPEIEELQNSGEIGNYVFIWDTDVDKWVTLESPPPSPEGKGQSRRDTRWTEYKVVGHDFVNLISGRLEGVTEIGCEFLSEESADYPSFGLKSQIILNLMDPKTEKSMSVKTRISNVERRGGIWIYRLSWKERPQI